MSTALLTLALVSVGSGRQEDPHARRPGRCGLGCEIPALAPVVAGHEDGQVLLSSGPSVALSIQPRREGGGGLQLGLHGAC